MRRLGKLLALVPLGICLLAAGLNAQAAPSSEWNPVRQHAPSTGGSARILVVFKETAANRTIKQLKARGGSRTTQFSQARTSDADVAQLLVRVHATGPRSRQLTPSMHVLLFARPLSAAATSALLSQLRADAAVAYADVDARRYLHAIPNDPLFVPTDNAAGQWFMQAPAGTDVSAVDAVHAWDITQGGSGVVIADVDSGYRFDHPDLQRAGRGGRLLPGYDFVGGDYSVVNGNALGTFLVANDGDGWDPDPTDPGDWINAADQTNTDLFPSSHCDVADSSWHGTRVAGVLGALTNNDAGIAGMTWNSYILPVRALGKCGGYDSDILTGIQWAAGLPVSGVPDNPYPADIINLSLGGSGSCTSTYQNIFTQLTGMGVLLVASAGNASGAVESPGNCKGVLTVAGLRNMGTKVGYSSLGPEVGIAAPAGNCVNSSGPCLRPIDTTSNAGVTVPGNDTYTDEINPSLGTSFSAPIVSGIAALMRSINGNLTPTQLIGRMEASATPFPSNTGNLPICSSTNATTSSGECSCVQGQCGAGMANAFSAVQAALRPIAAVSFPAHLGAGASVTIDGSGSTAACNQSLVTYLWSASGGLSISGVANAAAVTVVAHGTAAGTLNFTVTDASGNSDTATVNVTTAGAASSVAPTSAGSAANACPAPLTITLVPPSVALSFTPSTIDISAASTVTVTLTNANPFALTQAQFLMSLPAGLTGANDADSSCGGAARTVGEDSSSVSLSDAVVPASGSCTITFTLTTSTGGAYVATAGVGSLTTAPAGGNTAAVQASLNVTASTSTGSSSPPAGSSTASGGGGGGEMDWTDILLVLAIVIVCRSHIGRGGRPRP